jgi:signal transduction histidine kinase
MKRALNRGLEVLDGLRQFSRQAGDSEFVAVDLNLLAREAVQIAKPNLSMEVGRATCVHEDLGVLPPARGQPTEIVSALLNLIVNAVDAAPGGNITVRTREDHGGGCIIVADDGPGMTPEVQARIFEPFFTTKGPAGTGLGLAMVYATMKRHHGLVHLDTAPGMGAAFTLWFPAQPA